MQRSSNHEDSEDLGSDSQSHQRSGLYQRARRFGWFAWKFLLPPLVAVCVGYYFYKKLNQPELWADSLVLRPEWLALSALLYLVAQAIWGVNSVLLLWNQGAHVSMLTGLRAYYISQFGKYVPGKIWVLVLRVGMLGNIGISRTAVGITATYEALTAMAAGAMIGTLLLPTLATEQSGLSGYSAYWVAPVALTPIGLVGLNRFVNRVNRWRKGANAPQLPRVKLHVVLFGLVLTSTGWLLLGLSLWLALRGLGIDEVPLTLDTYLHLTSINALAYIIGFVAFFMPAGAGFREFALQSLLAIELAQFMPGDVGVALAAVTALVLRLIWTAAELIAAGLLYWLAPTHPPLSIGVEPGDENG